MSRRSRLVFAAACLALASGWGESRADPRPTELIYRYVEDGAVVFVDDPEKIPPEHRERAQIVIGPEVVDIYRYRAGGRYAYTNDWYSIPRARRSEAEILDLSHISLNHELAEVLSQAIDTQYESVIDSSTCRDARGAADAGWLATAWDRHGGVMVLAAALLVLLALTPTALRHVDAAVWGRILAVAVALLGAAGLTTYLFTETARQLDALEAWAEPCRHDGQPGSLGMPALVRSRVGAIRALQQRIAERDAALNAILHAR